MEGNGNGDSQSKVTFTVKELLSDLAAKVNIVNQKLDQVIEHKADRAIVDRLETELRQLQASVLQMQTSVAERNNNQDRDEIKKRFLWGLMIPAGTALITASLTDIILIVLKVNK